MYFTKYRLSWLWIGIVIIIIGFVNIYFSSPFPQWLQQEAFVDDTLETGAEEEKAFYDQCYAQNCALIENEWRKQCELLRLKCAEEHMFSFEKCKDDMSKYCNTASIVNCTSTCKKLWEVERDSRVARRNLAKTYTSTVLQKTERDLALGSVILSPPTVNYFAGPEYSIEFSINPENPSSTWRTILFFTTSAGDRTPAIWIHPGEDPKIHFRHATSASALGAVIESKQGEVQFKRWTHILVTVSNAMMQLYVNGSLSNTQKISGVFVWGNIHPRALYLRHPQSQEVHYGKLLMKDVEWYTKALTREEVAQVYASKK